MFKAAGRAGGMGEGRCTKAIGDDAESRALAYLQTQGLVLVQRNYRVALGPHARGAEVDLILRERDVGSTKQRRIVRAAQHYLLRLPSLPPCRFDVVGIDGGQVHWVQAAFDAG
jgi:putative endonuclease